ncbi:uncharacterized protein LOC126603047 [Malus sylvestris]|uniref:uncharacterized protein LOC126603047 n=1 Tax=Malus sylvestris TaxID=3752 RepID=UPI0021ABF68B|nr:uncharacterized protein LOC126603047 [Malus sylvestris]
MLKKDEELQNTVIKELEAARDEKLLPPEASPPFAQETSLSPPQVNPSEAGASASLPSHGPPMKFVISSPALDATPSSQFDPSTEVMLHFVDEGSNLPSPVYEPPLPSVVSDNEPIVPEIPVTSEVIVSWAHACPIVDIDEPPFSLAGGGKSSPQRGFNTIPGETPGLSQQVLKETSPPRLVRKSKCSHPHLSSRGTEIPPSGIEKIRQTEIAPHSSEQQRVFQEWARKDFNALFSLKTLCDLEKVTIESFKTGRLSKPQHDAFLSFFENLRALREQYQIADRQANRARCFMEKESSISAQVDRLMDESLRTKERVKVVTSEIQKLEEQLVALKAEQATLLDTLENQIEGVEKSNSELEHTRSQLVNSHTVLAEPSRIFAIMQTYHSRIGTLSEDVNFLE